MPIFNQMPGGVTGAAPRPAPVMDQAAQQQALEQARAQKMQGMPAPQPGPPGGMAGPGMAKPAPPGGGLAAQGFTPRPPMGQMPPAGQPGGGMAAAGARPPARPMAGGPSAMGMQQSRAQAGPFGPQTKGPAMQGRFPR